MYSIEVEQMGGATCREKRRKQLIGRGKSKREGGREEEEKEQIAERAIKKPIFQHDSLKVHK